MTISFFVILVFAIAFIVLYYWIITIIDIIKSDFENETAKYLWLVGVLVFPFVGTIVYRCVSHQFKKTEINEYRFVE